MRLVNILGASHVQHPEHGEADAGPDGVFDLAPRFAQALLKQPAQWRTEAEHIKAVSEKALRELSSNPRRAAEVLNFVHGRVTALEAQVAALREELDGRVTSLEDAAQAEQPAEPKSSSKK